MKITQEYLEYIVCPKCDTKMKIDYGHKKVPSTDGIYSMFINSPEYFGPGKTRESFLRISICNNCKVILGVSPSI